MELRFVATRSSWWQRLEWRKHCQCYRPPELLELPLLELLLHPPRYVDAFATFSRRLERLERQQEQQQREQLLRLEPSS
jgi:hypothetical protein